MGGRVGAWAGAEHFHTGSERGFTLIEVLVAFVIAALAIGVMVEAARGGLFAVRTAGRYEEGVSRARSHLAAIGRTVTLAEGELKGDDGGGYHWRVNVAPVAVSRLPGSDATPAQPAPPQPVTLYRITVAESWTEFGRTREVRLATQRLGAAPVPIDQ